MKLSKQKVALHTKAEELLKKDILSYDEKLFVLENWNESANHMNSSAGAFFTPTGLARDFNIFLGGKHDVIDLCAGIGGLAFFAFHFGNCNVTCVELNPDYVRVGKKILPEAVWINDSITDLHRYKLSTFDYAISNPPFGNIKTGLIGDWGLKYKGSEFEFITIEIASKLAKAGAFILPQMSVPFRYSGSRNYSDVLPSDKYLRFSNESGIDLSIFGSVDTSYYLESWKGLVKPMCELAECEFNG